MGDTKIRIDLTQGVVEAEGSEEFVRAIYDEFKDRVEFGENSDSHKNGDVEKKAPQQKKKSKNKVSKKKSRRSRSGITVNMLNNLDLSGGKNKPRLRDYYAKFQPTTNYQRNLIFVYYLTEELGLSEISIDHIYTCYRTVPGVKSPASGKAMDQSLRDTVRDKAWLNIDDMNDIKVGHAGFDYMELDMPKAVAES